MADPHIESLDDLRPDLDPKLRQAIKRALEPRLEDRKISAAEMMAILYEHVAPEDVLERSPVDIYGAAMSHYRLAATRPQGTATVRAFLDRAAEETA